MAARPAGDTEPGLAHQAERLAAVIDALSDLGEGLVITEAGKLVYANEAYRAMTGYSMEELAARSSLIELAPEELRAELSEGLGDILAGRRDPSHFLESQLLAKDGRRVDVESSIHMLPAETQTRIIAIVRDITARKRIEGEIRRLNDELEARVIERTEMLASARRELDSFSYSVSHDLRAPLRAIHGFARILEEQHGSELSPDALRLVGLIAENGELMARLVDTLLALSRLLRRDIRAEVVGMRPLAERAVEQARHAHPGHEPLVEVSDMPTVRADPELIRQLFFELVDNAFKFTRDSPRPGIRIAYDEVAGEGVFSVHDNGIGFDPRYHDKMFEVFQRLVRPTDYEGIGGGLAVARIIVERHGGRIWAESSPGEGAVFKFTLPANAAG